MHNSMHGVARGKRKEHEGDPSKIKPTTKRTGPAADEEQQRRIAARAAQAMEKQVRRRRDHRSFFMWGDRRKAVIKRFPDGTFEILVPQNLTPEQEHYEFPPRSRLLKKLASATAERSRLSLLDGNQVKRIDTRSPPKPDHNAMAEWFSSRQHKESKDQQVMDWMSDIEKSMQAPSTPDCGGAGGSTGELQLQSEIGKRWALSSGCNKSQSSLLTPPSETSPRKHYVPRRLLHGKNRPDDMQKIWRQYQQRVHKYRQGSSSAATASIISDQVPTSRAGNMTLLLERFQRSIEQREQQAQERMQHLENMLLSERQEREMQVQQHFHQLMQRVTRLEESVSQESAARQRLQHQLDEIRQQKQQKQQQSPTPPPLLSSSSIKQQQKQKQQKQKQQLQRTTRAQSVMH
ncbi:hypothetical protein VTP01DRAFT_3132 [Rhizomucor pusillus]|uniref:uncharacterized protein n=1 Tax=Rhizomucor pusillus TaxID=4840 RepID=UPI003744858A